MHDPAITKLHNDINSISTPLIESRALEQGYNNSEWLILMYT